MITAYQYTRRAPYMVGAYILLYTENITCIVHTIATTLIIVKAMPCPRLMSLTMYCTYSRVYGVCVYGVCVCVCVCARTRTAHV